MLTGDKRGDDALGCPVDGIVENELDGRITLYDPRRSVVHSLNATASDVWRLAAAGHSRDEIIAVLATAYDMPADDLRPHVEHVAATFIELGLLTPRVDG